MNLLKTITVVLVFGGAVFAQSNVSPVISMTWDWQDSTFAADQRIGVKASLMVIGIMELTQTVQISEYLSVGNSLSLELGSQKMKRPYIPLVRRTRSLEGLATEIEYVVQLQRGLLVSSEYSLTATF
jgi:hypothetical protein